ncbi:hypothetical protein [Gordonia sputi]
MDELTAVTVSKVVGANTADLRGDHTAEELARVARDFGLKWNSGRISDLEHGRMSPTIPTLFALAKALTALTERQISIADLLRTKQKWIAINETLTVRSEVVVDALTDGRPLSGHDRRQDPRDVAEAIRIEARGEGDSMRISEAVGSVSEAEARIARSLSMSKAAFVQASFEAWGTTFAKERDRRSGPAASPQKRGRISRNMKAELEQREQRSDGDDREL